MQTPIESPPPPPTITDSPQSINNSSKNDLPTLSPGLILTLPPTNSEYDIAPPDNPIELHAPIDSIFTTGDSSGNERSDNSSEGEEQNEPITEVKFSSFRKAHAKKRLNFNKDSDKITRKSAKPKREDPISVHSETQRMIRESKIHIPEYKPPVITLQDVMKKLPKLTNNTDAKPEIFVTTLASPVSLSAQTTSTPLPKAGPAQTDMDMEDLPDIDFISEQPIERLELTEIVEQIPKPKQTNSNQPALSLPNDFTNLNLATNIDAPVLSSLEAFKSRFIHHSLPPDKSHTSVPLSSETTENEGPLLPPGLSQKPGGLHAFLKEKLRRSLIAKRIQEHEQLELKLKYENEEFFPSEGSCSEAEDVERGEAVKLMDAGEGEVNGEWQPEGGDEISHSEDNNDTSSSESESDSETSESEESEIDSSNTDTEGEDGIIMPTHKAKRHVLNDSDNDDDFGDESAVNLDIQISQPLILDSPPNIPSLLLVQSPTLQLENEKESDLNSSINTSFTFPNIDAQQSFNLPTAFQLSTQSYIPDDLKRICDATQEGENDIQLICSGRFTQATQPDELNRNNDVIPNDSSLQLDNTVDTDLPMLAPRKIKVKDQLRLKRYRQLAAFEEKEAELSGSDPEFEGSDCASEFGNELDEYESEDGDQDLVESEEVERLNAKYYNQVMIEDDEANMELLKERFLPEQDIVEDGLRLKNGLFRKRKFNFDDDDDISSSAACDWDEDGRDQDVDQVTQERRRRRVEREDYIARKFKYSLSDLTSTDTTRTLPLLDKPNIIRSVSCEQKNTCFNVPSIRKSLGKHNSLLTRNFAAKLDSNFISDSNSGGNLVGRKSYVFQTIRSLEGGDSGNSVPPLIKSASLPPPSSSVGSKKNNFSKNTKLQPELKKEDSFLKPGSSVFHLLNVN
ncbi:Claspin-like [Oopsacas minuta]|uniref:Claspin-like n=1 Tax=Oopsacas minuta TaxID=111878 RepID=A0AAV7K5S0_9METZ|nr:Claspin-like [Oopsacas minuta]